MQARALALPVLLAAAALAAAGCCCFDEGAAPADAAPAAAADPAAPVEAARADLEARAGSTLRGAAVFLRLPDGRLRLVIEVEGVVPGLHAAHIHEHGDCSDPKAASAGGHWNPTGKPHGKWGQADGNYHLGDLGNIEVGADGTGRLQIETDLWSAGDGGPHDVVGRSIIVHAKPDDFTTQPTGDAGDRIGCGAIGKK
jgi:Cu-Zn family superoxide dismutase